MDRQYTSILKFFSFLAVVGMTLCACNGEQPGIGTDKGGNFIKVGGISSGVVGIDLSTKASETGYVGIGEDPEAENGEDVEWLIEPLKEGFDVTYGTDADNSHVAVLKLNENYSFADKSVPGGEDLYTFLYKNTEGGVTAGKKACWYDNGKHFFRGTNVPAGLYNEGPHDYEDLVKYIAIPPKTTIEATVGEVRIPYKHRLARLIVYVMIDPELMNKDNTPATIEGYSLTDGKDNPANTSLWFRNVQVLDHVEDMDGYDYPVPLWTKSSNVVPNFVSQETKVEYNLTQNMIIVGDGDPDSDYAAAAGDEIATYTNVPVYDIILRPTYNDEEMIMYDEQDPSILPESNTVDISLRLSNGLEYNESYKFDLDANHQTFLFVRISSEQVDFAESNSHTWIESQYLFHYFGVNNPDHNLSDAGSSWQRAWRIGTASDEVEDGDKYWDSENLGQYVSQEQWIENLKKAVVGGECHGDYFILDQDITLDLPADFVFTGHLDSRCHTVTAASNGYLFEGLNGNYTTAQETDMTQTWEANVHWETYDADYGSGATGVWIPILGYRAEIYNTTVSGGTLLKETPSIKTGHIYNCYDALHPASEPSSRIDFEYEN